MPASSRPRARPARPRALATALLALAVIVLLMVPVSARTTSGVPGPVAISPPRPTASPPIGAIAAPTPAAAAVVGVQLTAAASTFPWPADFLGSNVIAASNLPSNLSELVRASGARVLVWPGGGFGDRYDPIAGLLHDGRGVASPAPANESGFVALCRAVNCTAILQVPGEIDSPGYAAEVVRYTEQTLGFHPAYWEVGNEPGLWDHFGTPWANWYAGEAHTPSALEYAQEVASYGAAMTAVDPAIQILGLPGTGLGSSEEALWLRTVGSVDGNSSWLAGFAIHAYPAGIGRTAETEAHFLSTLTSKNSLPVRLPPDRAALAAACARCAGLPILATELGSADLNGTYDPYVEGFPDAVYLGAEVVQALELNLSNLDTFGVRFYNPGSWESPATGVRPSYDLFGDLLGRLGGSVTPLNTTGGVGGLYAIATQHGGSTSVNDVFVVNSNATLAATVGLSGLPGLSVRPAEVWTWNASSSGPVATYLANGTPPSWTLPPASLLLVETATPAEYPVVASEHGLPPGTRWFVGVGGSFASSADPTSTLLLPAGKYSVWGERATYFGPEGRRLPFPPSNVTVQGPTSIAVEYVTQFDLRTDVTPQGAGAVSPSPGWYNVTAPVNLVATPAKGFVFVGWTGSGSGAYTGSNPTVLFTLTWNTTEVATFAPASGSASEPTGPLGHLELGVAIGVALGLVVVAVLVNVRLRRRSPVALDRA